MSHTSKTLKSVAFVNFGMLVLVLPPWFFCQMLKSLAPPLSSFLLKCHTFGCLLGLKSILLAPPVFFLVFSSVRSGFSCLLKGCECGQAASSCLLLASLWRNTYNMASLCSSLAPYSRSHGSSSLNACFSLLPYASLVPPLSIAFCSSLGVSQPCFTAFSRLAETKRWTILRFWGEIANSKLVSLSVWRETRNCLTISYLLF